MFAARPVTSHQCTASRPEGGRGRAHEQEVASSCTRSSLLAQPCGYGALAQLGERRLCKPEVTGSIPVRSMREPAGNGRFPLSQRLQFLLDVRLWKRFWKRHRRNRPQASATARRPAGDMPAFHTNPSRRRGAIALMHNAGDAYATPPDESSPERGAPLQQRRRHRGCVLGLQARPDRGRPKRDRARPDPGTSGASRLRRRLLHLHLHIRACAPCLIRTSASLRRRLT
jgi:hypothetical protein